MVRLLPRLAADRIVAGAHDVSVGGLAVALARVAIAAGCGASVTMDTPRPTAALFGERAGRVILACEPRSAGPAAGRAGRRRGAGPSASAWRAAICSRSRLGRPGLAIGLDASPGRGVRRSSSGLGPVRPARTVRSRAPSPVPTSAATIGSSSIPRLEGDGARRTASSSGDPRRLARNAMTPVITAPARSNDRTDPRGAPRRRRTRSASPHQRRADRRVHRRIRPKASARRRAAWPSCGRALASHSCADGRAGLAASSSCGSPPRAARAGGGSPPAVSRDLVPEDGKEDIDHGRVELGRGVAPELGKRLGVGEGRLVRSFVDHGVVGVGHGHDPSAERDLLAAQAVRIAPPSNRSWWWSTTGTASRMLVACSRMTWPIRGCSPTSATRCPSASRACRGSRPGWPSCRGRGGGPRSGCAPSRRAAGPCAARPDRQGRDHVGWPATMVRLRRQDRCQRLGGAGARPPTDRGRRVPPLGGDRRAAHDRLIGRCRTGSCGSVPRTWRRTWPHRPHPPGGRPGARSCGRRLRRC